ncbi:MAG: hypothetical protein KME35_01440 [Aphanocapsa sp. GSE-SYN-MK-11-07L]|jgi:hypothetical protein|nr:hypothetical protein [Aphanocapsa sp. GSE-SYN-MK-11-07L]
MKILAQSDTTLKLQTSKAHTWAGLLVCLAIAAGGFAAVFWTGQVRLTCDRSGAEEGNLAEVNCQLKKMGWLGLHSLRAVNVNQLQGANLKESPGEDGSTYRIFLITSTEQIPFRNYSHSGYRDQRAIVDQINTFIANPQSATLIITSTTILEWVGLIVGGLVCLICLSAIYQILIAAAQPTDINRITFEKNQFRLLVEYGSLLNRGATAYALSEVTKILLSIEDDLATGLRLELRFGQVMTLCQLSANQKWAKIQPIAAQVSAITRCPYQIVLTSKFVWDLTGQQAATFSSLLKQFKLPKLSVQTWIFDPATEQVTCVEENIIVQSYEWRAIADVLPTASGSKKVDAISQNQLCLVFTSGQEVIVYRYTSTEDGPSGAIKAQTVAQYLREFLKLA